VCIPLAVTQFDILEAMPFLRRSIQRLAEHGDVTGAQGYLAHPGAEQGACGLDEIADVKKLADVGIRILADDIFPDVELEFAVTVANVGEDGFSHVAIADDASGEGD